MNSAAPKWDTIGFDPQPVPSSVPLGMELSLGVGGKTKRKELRGSLKNCEMAGVSGILT